MLLLSILLALVSICYVGGMSYVFDLVLVYMRDSLIFFKRLYNLKKIVTY